MSCLYPGYNRPVLQATSSVATLAAVSSALWTRFTHPKYQVLFMFCVVGVQMLIVLISNVFKYPAVHQQIHLNLENVNLLPTVVVTCDQEHLAFLVLAMIYLSAIPITTTVLGL